MRRVFKVGEIYHPYQEEFAPIKILRRTDKNIWVDNGCSRWRMKVYIDELGNEFAIDKSVSHEWLDAFTYFA